MIGPSEAHHLFDHLPLRIDLDGIHAAVRALVAVLVNGVLEGAVQLVDTAAQDVREAQQQRQADAALPHLVNQGFQVDGVARLVRRRHQDVAGVADAEVAPSPIVDPVGLDRIRHRPGPWKGPTCF